MTWSFKNLQPVLESPLLLDIRQASLLVAAHNAQTSMRCKPYFQMLTQNEQNCFTHSDSPQHLMNGPCVEHGHTRQVHISKGMRISSYVFF